MGPTSRSRRVHAVTQHHHQSPFPSHKPLSPGCSASCNYAAHSAPGTDTPLAIPTSWHFSPVACRALPEQPGRDGEPVPAGTACPERSPPPTASTPQCQGLDTGPPRHLLRNQAVETGLLQIKDESRGIKVCCSSAYDLEATDQQEEGALFSLGAAARWVRISRMNLNNSG